MKVLKSKKVIAALVALALAVVGAVTGVDLSAISGSATEAACAALTCA